MKAVILAAWYWTRMLPITKTIPKELLPVWDKPVIQYMVESLVENNIKDIVMITSQWKTAIEDYFDKNYELEEKLKNKNKIDLLEKINKPKDIANICFVKQKELLWTWHAVLQAEKWIDDNYFMLILWDSIFHPQIYKQALELHKETGKAIIVANEIPKEDVYKYWVLEIKNGEIVDMIEKPSVEDAPSNLIIPWIYILPKTIFEIIHKTPLDPKLWEILLPDSMKILMKNEKILPCITDKKIRDIWTPELRYQANKDFFENNWKLFD